MHEWFQHAAGLALAWAAQGEGGAPPAGGGAQTGPTGFPPELLMMFIVLGLFFYMIVLRPQKMEQRKREEMIDQLAKGDRVVTAGGIHGRVESFDRDKGIVSVSVAPKVNIEVSRSSIGSVVEKKDKSDKSDKKPGK